MIINKYSGQEKKTWKACPMGHLNLFIRILSRRFKRTTIFAKHIWIFGYKKPQYIEKMLFMPQEI